MKNEEKNEEKKKKSYEAPECEVLRVQAESFVCTSVNPKVPGSTEEEWENEEEENGGVWEL